MRFSGKAAGGRNPDNPVVHYGSRKGPKLIRIYRKEELDVFRIEGEFHSSFLRLHGIDSEHDIGSVADEFCPAHIRFVEIDWKRLRTYVRKKHDKEQAAKILASARKRESSIRRVTRYLRRKGILNVHRFYRPLSINKQIKRALERWSTDYDYEWQMARMKTDRRER
jgi:hypothetical protein